MFWQRTFGVALGLALGCTIARLPIGSRFTVPTTGPILSECDGTLSQLVIHYEPSAKKVVLPVYKEFLSQLDPGTAVHVVCPTWPAFNDLVSSVGTIPCRMVPLVVNHPITTWSRDRWVALAPVASANRTTLVSPRGEAGDEIWPARAGDERIGDDLATALPCSIMSRRSEFYFDGGDFLSDAERVFVIGRVLGRNIQHTAGTRKEFEVRLRTLLGKPIVMLEQSPDHHAAMFMAAVGNRTVVVGDPSLARPYLSSDYSHEPAGSAAAPGGCDFEPDFTPETQARFDAVATQCGASGYRVVRIPVVPGRDGRSYITYSNVIIDARDNQRIVYLPIYAGADELNKAARAVWDQLGFMVRTVDCTSTFRHFGCLHCLVSVLKRF
jgi:hypothetical protein